MLLNEVRHHCDACNAGIDSIVYDITVHPHVISPSGPGATIERQPIGKPLDLQICVKCANGINTHALPLAIEHRTQQLDRAARPAPVIPQPQPQRRN